MNTVMLFDTSVASLNIGDQIIMDATQKQLRKLFPDDYFLTTLMLSLNLRVTIV